MNKVVAGALLLIASCPCFADWKFETHTTVDSDASPQVRITYVKGQRVRYEVPNTGNVTIFQCDQNRSLTIDTFSKSFSAVTFSKERLAGEAKATCCGVIRTQQQVTQPGDHQQMLGLDAEHMITEIKLEPDANACARDANLQREVDGWYVDQVNFPDCARPGNVSLSTAARLEPSKYPTGDRYVVQGKGVDPNLLALKLVVRDNRPGQPPTVLTREVVSLSSDPLSDDLFDVPAGFTERSSEAVSIPPSNCAGTTINSSAPRDATLPYRLGPGIVAPKPLYHPEPSYTDAARKAKVSGTVLLSLTVTSEGRVDAVRVERSLRSDLDEQALTTVSSWRFEPGTKDGVPVPVRLNVEVSFKLL